MKMKNEIILALTGILTIFSPIYAILWLIILVCSVDLVTAIHKDWKKYREDRSFWRNLKVIKSRKLRRTFTKISYYLIIVMLLYAIPVVSLGAPILAIWIARMAAFSILAHEMYSIGENVGVITGDNIFNKIIRNSVKKLNEWTNKKIEDPHK